MKILFFLLSTVASLNAITIKCIYSDYPWKTGTVYSCEATQCKSEENKKLTKVTGDHLPNHTNNDVRVVYFQSCLDLDFIPQGIHHIFPKLNGLQFWNNSISTLTGNELNEYENLEWFVFQRQNVKHIPGNLFCNNPKIKKVWFHFSTELKTIGENLLNTIKKLEIARFHKSNCISMDAMNVSEIPALVASLREKCAITEATTGCSMITTSTSTSIPTTSTSKISPEVLKKWFSVDESTTISTTTLMSNTSNLTILGTLTSTHAKLQSNNNHRVKKTTTKFTTDKPCDENCTFDESTSTISLITKKPCDQNCTINRNFTTSRTTLATEEVPCYINCPYDKNTSTSSTSMSTTTVPTTSTTIILLNTEEPRTFDEPTSLSTNSLSTSTEDPLHDDNCLVVGSTTSTQTTTNLTTVVETTISSPTEALIKPCDEVKRNGTDCPLLKAQNDILMQIIDQMNSSSNETCGYNFIFCSFLNLFSRERNEQKYHVMIKDVQNINFLGR